MISKVPQREKFIYCRLPSFKGKKSCKVFTFLKIFKRFWEDARIKRVLSSEMNMTSAIFRKVSFILLPTLHLRKNIAASCISQEWLDYYYRNSRIRIDLHWEIYLACAIFGKYSIHSWKTIAMSACLLSISNYFNETQ